MAGPVPVNVREVSVELKTQHELFQAAQKTLRCPTAVATLLVLGALIVIGSSCLCLTLPGVNVMSDVILPGVVPGAVAIVLSIPFIVKCVLLSKPKTALMEKEVYPRVIKIMDANDIELTVPPEVDPIWDKALDAHDYEGLSEPTIQKLRDGGFGTLRKILKAPLAPLTVLDFSEARARQISEIAVQYLLKKDPELGNNGILDQPIILRDHKDLDTHTIAILTRGGQNTLRKLQRVTIGPIVSCGFTPEEAWKILKAAHKKIPFLDQRLDAHDFKALNESRITKPHDFKVQNESAIRKLNDEEFDSLRKLLRARVGALAAIGFDPKVEKEIFESAVKKFQVNFVESMILTMEPQREYQDYYKTILVRATKEYGESKKEHKATAKRCQTRMDALKGALQNLFQPPWKTRN